MLRKSAFAFLFASAIFTIACQPKPEPDNRPAEQSAIRTLDEQWSAIAGKNDLDATLAYYADDAVLLPPNAPIASDKKSIHDSWAGLLGPFTAVSWKATKVEVSKSGDLGYLYGTYKLAITDPKGRAVLNDTGKILEVWKKQFDGTWKCMVDTYNSDLPVSPAPAAQK